MKLEELKKQLKEKTVVKFTFNKKDDSTGDALATLNEFLIPIKQVPKDKEEQTRNLGTNLKYFDVKKAGWRSLVYDCSTVVVDEEYITDHWDELARMVSNMRKKSIII